MRTRFDDLLRAFNNSSAYRTGGGHYRIVGAKLDKGTHLSDPRINTLGLTVRYFPFPQPTSSPTDAVGSSRRKRSTIGHGYVEILLVRFDTREVTIHNRPANSQQRAREICMQNTGSSRIESEWRGVLNRQSCAALVASSAPSWGRKRETLSVIGDAP